MNDQPSRLLLAPELPMGLLVVIVAVSVQTDLRAPPMDRSCVTTLTERNLEHRPSHLYEAWR